MHRSARILFAQLILFSLACVIGVLLILYVRNSGETADTETRVQTAREHAADNITAFSEQAGIDYPPKRVFFRAFKTELELEVWGSNADGEKFVLLHTYSIARASGKVGPKRKEHDYQVPEGVYFIDRFNPNSNFHLSLGLNYPNKSDLIRGDPDEPGSEIFIHGNRVSIGCLAMTDEKIEEIYVLALGAKEAGQKKIPVHIFPARFGSNEWKKIQSEHSEDSELLDFWNEIRPIFEKFEETKLPPTVTVSSDGSYHLTND